MTSRRELSLDQPVGEDGGDCLVDLVAALPQLEREVIMLRFFQDLDQYEIRPGSAAPSCTSPGSSAVPWPHAGPCCWVGWFVAVMAG